MDLARNRKDRGLFLPPAPTLPLPDAASCFFRVQNYRIASVSHHDKFCSKACLDAKGMFMTKPVKHLPDEADIGSGEKSPGQKDTEKMIEQVGNKTRERDHPDAPVRQPDKEKDQNAGTTGGRK
jgi:hypothetical protein